MLYIQLFTIYPYYSKNRDRIIKFCLISIGTVAVACSVPFIYIGCPGSRGVDQWAQFIYYAAFVAIFQIGWAIVQTAHLALLADLAGRSANARIELSAWRSASTLYNNSR